MIPGDYRITVECLRTGQPRPYADHLYEAIITCEVVPYKKREIGEVLEFEPAKWNRDVVLKHAQSIREFYDKPEWHQPRLESLTEIKPGVWRMIVTQPYLD